MIFIFELSSDQFISFSYLEGVGFGRVRDIVCTQKKMVGILNKRAGDQLIKYFCPQNNKESSASVGFHGSKERVSH